MSESDKEWLRGDKWSKPQIAAVSNARRIHEYKNKISDGSKIAFPTPGSIVPVDNIGEYMDSGMTREFCTGATRDTAEGKLDFEGFLSPRVLEMFGHYMNKNRVQSDGSTRDSDNWQKGIPMDVYMKSAWRHFFDMWKEHRGLRTEDGKVAALCGLLFNVMGYMHELSKDVDNAHEAEERRGG